MAFTANQNEFINEYVKALKENNAVVFAGAGMSVDAGFFDWERLLKPVADSLGLDIREEYDLTMLAQFYVDARGSNRGRLSQLLTEEYSKSGNKPTNVHKICARLPIQIYWTTNYDQLIERALKENGKTPDVKKSQSDLSVNKPKRDAIIYKMHGDIDTVAETVLTKHEYEDYNETRQLFSNAFLSDYVSRTIVFIGFSFKDPNLDFLISRIRVALKHNKREDFHFVKREKEEKAQSRQNIRIKSLQQYGLHPIWIDDYPEIEMIMKEVETRYLRSTVLISGSAAHYGRFTESEAMTFLHNLGRSLSQNQFKILSGFGIGVGSLVINGVLENMQEQNNQNLDEYIIMRPFPQVAAKGNLKDTWSAYRKNFIPLAGIAVFVFGNKMVDEKIVDAGGVIEEFEIAVANGLKVIPVGATGSVSEQLYERLMNDFGHFYPEHPDLKKVFEKLNDKNISSEKLITVILDIVKVLNQT